LYPPVAPELCSAWPRQRCCRFLGFTFPKMLDEHAKPWTLQLRFSRTEQKRCIFHLKASRVLRIPESLSGRFKAAGGVDNAGNR